MTFITAKLTEMPLRSSFSISSSSFLLNPPFRGFINPFSRSSYPYSSFSRPNSPWLSKWAPLPTNPNPERIPRAQLKPQKQQEQQRAQYLENDKSQNAIERIVLRLRNLGLGEEEEEEEEEEGKEIDSRNCEKNETLTGEERLGDLLARDWARPDEILKEEEEDGLELLPWEREERSGEREGDGAERTRRKVVRAPTLAELTIEDEELRRLRRDGMFVRERISIPKAGLTREVMEKIHDKWRKVELVRLKFHEVLANDMRTAHEIVECRTGGLVIWRSGSVMVVFRGHNYQGPKFKSRDVVGREDSSLFVPDVSSTDVAGMRSGGIGDDFATSSELKIEVAVRRTERAENMTEEEVEYNSLLDGLGPRFEEWWGTGVLPVDADLLRPKVPGYKTPFRLLPTGMRSRLTNAEMTNLRKIAKSLPCHFALGRNRNHQGLAAAIIKLWEKSLVVKIAVKRGIQNTNNKIMADELKALTGGVLLLRNKYFIVMYRGKDFLPTTVAAALAERNEQTKQSQDVEDKMRGKVDAVPMCEDEGRALAGTLAEFYEAQSRWGRDISTEEHEKMVEEASKAKQARVVKRIEHKLAIGQAKKLRAERLLAKIEASMVPAGPDYDQETITDEERAMFRRVGLRMKAYLPLGVRGVFDGVIENMHLHWKHRELVKLISKQKTLAFVEDTARLLEYESGGILVAMERVPKGFALIYYRGKNYRRPISLRPRNLLTKAKALKRSVAMQRHEALSQHISELERTIDQMKKEIGLCEDNSNWSTEKQDPLKHCSELTQSDDTDLYIRSEGEEDTEDYVDEDEDDDQEENGKDDDLDSGEDIHWELDNNFKFSSSQNA